MQTTHLCSNLRIYNIISFDNILFGDADTATSKTIFSSSTLRRAAFLAFQVTRREKFYTFKRVFALLYTSGIRCPRLSRISNIV